MLTGHPAFRSPLFGRASEIQALAAAVARGRLVTLVGAPGVGKTRLALGFVEGASPARGVVFCDLTACATADEVAAAVLRAAAHVAGPGEPVEVAGRALAAGGRSIWILDGFETPGAVSTLTLGRWLAQAPSTSFIVTSRSPLGLTGEAVLRIEPLPVPAVGVPFAEATSNDALALLLDRRALHLGGQPPVAAEFEALAELARRLEGVPLALELAAARLRTNSAVELLEALAAERSPLTGGPEDGSPHHRSMDACVSWSWRTLETPLRRALGALSVFRGGFTREAARAVLGPAEASPREAFDTADVVDALVERSLLRVTRAEPRRFAPYEVVRAHAVRHTPPDEVEAARARHAAHFAETFRDAGEWATSGDALRRLALDADNLTTALRWVAAHPGMGSATYATELALGLDALLTIRGPSGEHERVLMTAWAAHETTPVDALLAIRLADALGRQAINRGDVPRAIAWLERAVACARALGDVRWTGRTLDHLACAEMYHRPGAAPPLLEEALTLLRAAGDFAGEGRTLSNLGICRYAEGRFDAARGLLEDALVRLRASGDSIGAANTWSVLGALYHAAPCQDLARACYGAALETYRDIGNGRREAAVTGNLALVEQEAGRFAEAAKQYEQTLERAERVDARLIGGVFAGYFGTLEHERGRLLEARLRYREALRIADAAGDLRYGAYFRGCLAVCEAAEGHTEAATALLSAADEQGHGLGDRILASALAIFRLAGQRGPNDAGPGVERARTRLRSLAENDGEAYDVRLAQRLVQALLGSGAAVEGGGRPPGILLIARDGCRFRAPGGAIGDVGRRLAARRLLQRLAAERERCPGRALSPDVLFEAGWPGDRSRRTSALNRVHVTLATLRQLGLRDVLCRRGLGYLLDPEVPFEVVEAV